jgi:hypothetical protein
MGCFLAKLTYPLRFLHIVSNRIQIGLGSPKIRLAGKRETKISRITIIVLA